MGSLLIGVVFEVLNLIQHLLIVRVFVLLGGVVILQVEYAVHLCGVEHRRHLSNVVANRTIRLLLLLPKQLVLRLQLLANGVELSDLLSCLLQLLLVLAFLCCFLCMLVRFLRLLLDVACFHVNVFQLLFRLCHLLLSAFDFLS